MKHWKFILILFCLFFATVETFAQETAEYNRRGDEALARQDLSDAKMWYEEGVSRCDSYSIKRLTELWLSHEEMRLSMRSLMNKCLNCLTVSATEDDPQAIEQLVVYYREGIGTPKNEELAVYWENYREELLAPKEEVNAAPDTIVVLPEPRERMRFFVTYTYSIEAPFGIRIGGLGKRLGWYAQFKSNLSFQEHTVNCDQTGELLSFNETDASYQATGEGKRNTLLATAGMVVRCTNWMNLSVGLGYGMRDVLHQFVTYSYEDINDQQQVWAKNADASARGIVLEADASFVVAGPVFVGVGVHTVNFDYVDLNASVGVFF